MDKKLIVIIASLVLIVVVVGLIGSPENTDTLSDFEIDEYSDASIDFSSESFSADSFDLSNMTSDKLQAFEKALQFLENQNQILENQLERAEKKTTEITGALGKLSDKINLIPTTRKSVQISRSSGRSQTIDSTNVSPEIIALCEEKLADLYKTQRSKEGDYISKKLNDEPFDDQWTVEVDTMLSSVISRNNLVGTDVETVSCRTTVCEIVLNHDSPRSMMEFHRRLPRGLKLKFAESNTGSLTENVFLMRPLAATSYNN